MSGSALLVAIVAILSFTVLKLARMKMDADRGRDERFRSQDSTEEDRREIEELRERIKVLERIATEGEAPDAREARRIAAEIEALREKQAD